MCWACQSDRRLHQRERLQAELPEVERKGAEETVMWKVYVSHRSPLN